MSKERGTVSLVFFSAPIVPACMRDRRRAMSKSRARKAAAPAEPKQQKPNHFSSEWNPDVGPTLLFLSGAIPLVRRTDGHLQASLPEMHVLLACPESTEVIDF